MEGEQNNVNAEVGKGRGGLSGPIIGAIVILAIIILGGLYFWSQRTPDLITEETVESINIQSEADDTDSIEADLDATDIENLDVELNAS